MSTIQALLETMNRLQTAYEALLELSLEKTQVLVRNDVDQLNFIVNKENKLMRGIVEADQLRVQVINEYLIARGYNPNPKITVSDLVKIIFKAEEKQSLAEAQRSLLEIVARLKERNAVNQQLVEQSLYFINYSLDLVIGAPEDDVVYQNPHQAKGGNRMGMFDTKA
ncbi:flagellar protein FlgN [Paenibacillus athensensis]|uniref:Flagellar biosynthesis protein FlgN n=1 Tax=Paenibacillus athensensis TaxID=1967502 RepID=A0A4Y8Q4J7_9BACL|nr:flagellar protein FlgN [Paenibacillus athensensis]MCD1260849.1 flagellar protein FlgN [Paenibacillus athensensis]